MDYNLIERDAFQIVGMKQQLKADDELDRAKEISHFWTHLGETGILDQLMTLNNGQIVGLIGATMEADKGNDQKEYIVGVEFKGETPESFIAVEFPPAKWAVFKITGAVAELMPKTWEKIHSQWLPTRGYQLGEGPSMEVYKSPDTESSTAKTEFWVSVK